MDLVASADIPAGTSVSSHVLRYNRPVDPVHPEAWYDPTITDVITGTVSFDEPIFAVLATPGDLDESDFLGSPETVYPAHPSSPIRGFEPDHDYYRIVGLSTVEVRIHPSDNGDQMRILTRSATVPEPGALALLGVSVLPLVGLRRRK